TTMLDDLLHRYYETGDAESLREIIHETQPLVIRLLAQCVADPAIRVRIWDRTIRKVRLGWNHRELRFDLNRGKPGDATPASILATALHSACRWLVWYEHLDTIVD